jgi:TonB family protein
MKIKVGATALLFLPIVGVCDPLPKCPRAVAIVSQLQAPGVVRGHGAATVEFCLEANGRVDGVRIVQSSGNKEFDDAAITTVAGGYYVRPTVDGKLVACCTTMQVKGLSGSVLRLVHAVVRSPTAQAKVENCGWLVTKGNVLEAYPDVSLKPSGPAPLPVPPPGARAAYCDRDSLLTYVGDERVLKFGLPLILRSGGREGVLEVDTSVFNYHRVGDQYVPGKVEN